MTGSLGTRVALVAATGVMVVGVVLATTGCVRVPIERQAGSTTPATPRIEVGEATRADVTIAMGAGELFVSGGTSRGDLMDAEFDFRPASWEPEVTYEVRGERGILEVRQPRVSGFPTLGGVTNRWDIALSEDLPIDLEANLGAGTTDLRLGGLDIRDLRVALGAGDVMVDLTGERANDMRATIEGGAGSVRVRVPSDVGVRVSGTRTGLGSFEIDGFTRDGEDYVNDAYGRSAVTIELRVSQGVGEVVIEQGE